MPKDEYAVLISVDSTAYMQDMKAKGTVVRGYLS